VFTGIVEELGKVGSRNGSRLRINSTTVLEGSDLGASIAVNGCCLTVVATDGSSYWDADVSDETYSRTNLGSLQAGDVVNLERPMALGERLGGHMVLGHVDAVGHVVSPAPDLVIRIPRDLMHLIVEKGSVTEIDYVNGAVVALGERLGVATPVNRSLVALVKGLESRLAA
jgi:riboflavin synthase